MIRSLYRDPESLKKIGGLEKRKPKYKLLLRLVFDDIYGILVLTSNPKAYSKYKRYAIQYEEWEDIKSNKYSKLLSNTGVSYINIKEPNIVIHSLEEIENFTYVAKLKERKWDNLIKKIKESTHELNQWGRIDNNESAIIIQMMIKNKDYEDLEDKQQKIIKDRMEEMGF